MHKSSFIRARVEPGLKRSAEHVLEELGITPTQAITMLYKKIARDQEWPLELKVPNEVTLKAMKDVEEGHTHKAKNSSALFEQLDDDNEEE